MSETDGWVAQDVCDYCADALRERFNLRAVGFTSLVEDGPESPLVKAWCGTCETPDDVDPAAHAALKRAIEAQTGRAS